MDWKTIDTAPKDGTTIQGWSEFNGSRPIEYVRGEWITKENGSSWCFYWHPTHWTCLPPPPTDDPCVGCHWEKEKYGTYFELCGLCARFYPDEFKPKTGDVG